MDAPRSPLAGVIEQAAAEAWERAEGVRERRARYVSQLALRLGVGRGTAARLAFLAWSHGERVEGGGDG